MIIYDGLSQLFKMFKFLDCILESKSTKNHVKPRLSPETMVFSMKHLIF